MKPEMRRRVSQIPYKQMFAQAVAELRNPDCIYWFTSDDEREIQQHNSQYQQESAPELVLSQIFEPVQIVPSRHPDSPYIGMETLRTTRSNPPNNLFKPFEHLGLGLLDPALAASEFQPESPRRSSAGSFMSIPLRASRRRRSFACAA